ncbi:MAG TPA: SusC/RagA family TonB-linked outer membrane protein [Puia sp.]|nr:SusC/RagA family TonB-linked outer membrane protein [Puia sp.]
MKLTTLLLFTLIFHVSARTRAQTVTWSGKNVPLTTVFSVIKKQTGYLFFYRQEDLAGSSPVTLDFRNTPLQQALTETLAAQPLNFTIEGNTIFITLKSTAPATNPATNPAAPETAPPPPPDSIHGRILDSLGTPLAGASVMVKGSKRGTVTDARGEFVLKGIPPENVTLMISYTGFAPREYKVKDGSRAYILMARSSDPLDDVQVVAYGTNTRRFSVGSVTTVTSEDIAKQPVSNVLMALEGRVPGLTVTPSSGSPGAYAPIQVRGQNTLISSLTTNQTGMTLNRLLTNTTPVAYDQPLFIVDGVPFAPGNQNISVLNALGGYNTVVPNGGISSLGGINPSDIESISVLKDADATSIYGSQGANGVIVITTKKGKPGKTNFNVKVNTGPNTALAPISLLSTKQYLAMRREAAANDGVNPASQPALFPDLLVFDTTRYVDWYHRFFGGTAYNTDAYASLTGGTSNTSFLLSGGYTRSNYNYPGNFADNRYTLHSGFHYNSLDRRLTVDFGTDYSYDRNASPSAPVAGPAAMMLPPNLPELTDPQGNLVWSYKGVDLSQNQQLSYLKQPSSLQNYGLNGSLRVAYQVLRGLNLSANLGYNRINTKQQVQDPLSSQAPTAVTGSAQFANTDYLSYNVEPQLDYKANLGRGLFTGLLGGTFKSNSSSGTTLVGNGYPNDALLGSIDAASSITAYDAYNIYKYVGVFARLGYVYDREFIVSLTGRRDGSSNFGPGRQFGSFGSAGLGWIFSEEQAFRRLLPLVSYAKISGNYGTNGSDGVSPYQYEDYWKLQTAVPPFQGTRGYQPNNLYNPDYSWSTKTSLNIALDLGFFHDRLLINGDWYRNRTSDQLVNYYLPSQTGFLTVVENLHATLQDAGWEATLTSVNIRKPKFQWRTTFNISANRNKLLSFPGIATSSYASIYTVGKSTSDILGFRYKGINDTTGIFQFATGKGGATYTPTGTPASKGGDLQTIANLEPRFAGGLGNTFTYGGISLTAFFRFTKQMGHNYLFGLYNGLVPGGEFNLPALATNHWRAPGDHAPMERLTTGIGATGSLAARAANYFNASSGAFSDASYIRLQTLSLSYTLPAAYVKKVGMKNASIYVNAQNLLTITSYKVGDPQTPGSLYGIPLQRIVSGGISLDF